MLFSLKFRSLSVFCFCCVWWKKISFNFPLLKDLKKWEVFPHFLVVFPHFPSITFNIYSIFTKHFYNQTSKKTLFKSFLSFNWSFFLLFMLRWKLFRYQHFCRIINPKLSFGILSHLFFDYDFSAVLLWSFSSFLKLFKSSRTKSWYVFDVSTSKYAFIIDD